MERRLILNALGTAAAATWLLAGCSSANDRPAQTNAGGLDNVASDTLDPNTDWNAWDIVYSPMYSAFDGVHVFSLPAYVNGVATALEDWQAMPQDAVTFSSWASDDGSQVGVLITVNRYEPEVAIAASTGGVGGRATLYITEATPEQWEIGENRYKNGAEFDLNALMSNPQILMMVEFVNGMPVFNGTAAELGLETNLRCDGCHTAGADQFRVEHTPTQAARFSDQDLVNIFTMGKKPPGVGFRAIPEMFSGFYEFMHTWAVTDEEVQGLIVYLRSLTPKGQGDILLPTGMLAAPNADLSMLPPECDPTGAVFDVAACTASLPEVCMQASPMFDIAACTMDLGIDLGAAGAAPQPMTGGTDAAAGSDATGDTPDDMTGNIIGDMTGDTDGDTPGDSIGSAMPDAGM